MRNLLVHHLGVLHFPWLFSSIWRSLFSRKYGVSASSCCGYLKDIVRQFSQTYLGKVLTSGLFPIQWWAGAFTCPMAALVS